MWQGKFYNQNYDDRHAKCDTKVIKRFLKVGYDFIDPLQMEIFYNPVYKKRECFHNSMCMTITNGIHIGKKGILSLNPENIVLDKFTNEFGKDMIAVSIKNNENEIIKEIYENDKNVAYMLCTIPVGSMFFENEFGELISESLRIDEEVPIIFNDNNAGLFNICNKTYDKQRWCFDDYIKQKTEAERKKTEQENKERIIMHCGGFFYW